jgi:hypothetical protein
MRTRRRKHSDAIGRAETGVEGPGGARRGGEPWTRRGLGGATERRGGASFALLAPVRDCQRSRRRHGGGLFSFFEQRMPAKEAANCYINGEYRINTKDPKEKKHYSQILTLCKENLNKLGKNNQVCHLHRSSSKTSKRRHHQHHRRL